MAPVGYGPPPRVPVSTGTKALATAGVAAVTAATVVGVTGGPDDSTPQKAETVAVEDDAGSETRAADTTVVVTVEAGTKVFECRFVGSETGRGEPCVEKPATSAS